MALLNLECRQGGGNAVALKFRVGFRAAQQLRLEPASPNGLHDACRCFLLVEDSSQQLLFQFGRNVLGGTNPLDFVDVIYLE